MAKKEKAVYAPGELGRVRDNLGIINEDEARRVAQALGGEIGYERSDEEEKARTRPKNVRHERVDVKIGGRPLRRKVELASDVEEEPGKQRPKREKAQDPADDPSVLLKVNYWERIKMDKFAGQSQFDIKSPSQVLFSMLSVFGDIPDYVNPRFITKRMKEYYRQFEILVVSTRTLFPRNNIKRNEKLKKTTPLAFAILDTIRYWSIDRISGDLARLQAHPKNVKVEDCADILRALYKPLFVLDRLDMDAHIRGAYKILYKALYIENPMDAQSKYQDLIRSALSAYGDIRRDIHYLMYPLLMKAISAQWLPYERFFIERKNRIMAFLKVSEEDQLDPASAALQDKNEADNVSNAEEVPDEDKKEDKAEETPEEQTRRNAVESEKKALERGLRTLETLFPNAGWDRLASFPDLYPYFVDIFGLRKGFVNIAPTDPLQQVFILMRIIEEFFFGLRYVSFGTIPELDGRVETIEGILTNILNNWRYYLEFSFEKEYLPRLSEYVRMLEGSPEDWNSPYTKKIIADLHWTKRLYFLPYYKFESLTPPSFQKKDITPIYPEIKKLRRYLTAVGAGIERGKRAGRAESRSPCDGIENPWAPYIFQVSNPLSTRMDALLPQKSRTNASLIFFTLAAVTVLDYLVNNENSWAYGRRPGPLFRSVGGEGISPLTGIDVKIDADALFKASLKNRQPG